MKIFSACLSDKKDYGLCFLGYFFVLVNVFYIFYDKHVSFSPCIRKAKDKKIYI